MDLIILAMDNVIFQDLDLLLTIISLILNTFHVLKKMDGGELLLL
ncbi:Uncharacterised protein [Escherichia coli]|uniref:Uncharacterized protein n=1 Tax=Escherichia coli TaxID=562 RepID=A0A484YRT4_ECOLX|nr:Uncharacterised protein [Escherichia coli]